MKVFAVHYIRVKNNMAEVDTPRVSAHRYALHVLFGRRDNYRNRFTVVTDSENKRIQQNLNETLKTRAD